MKINRDNYELFFINYFDGQLKPEEVDALMSFLKDNPTLEDEFYNFNNLKIIDTDTISFDNKNTLKKNISDKAEISASNIDEFLIALIENDLTASDIKRLNAFLDDKPTYKKDLELYRKSIFEPDQSITFKNKKSLKRKTDTPVRKINYFYYSLIAAAACILLFFNIFFSNDIHFGMKSGNKENYLEAGLNNVLLNNNDNYVVIDTADISATNPIQNEMAHTKPPYNSNFTKITQKSAVAINTQNNNIAQISDKRDEYSSIFNYIQESEYKTDEDTYADIMPEQPKDSFLKYAANKIFNKKDEENIEDNNKIDLWQVVDIGTYGINSLVKDNLIDIKRTQEDNTVKTDFALGGNVVYSHSSSKKQK